MKKSRLTDIGRIPQDATIKELGDCVDLIIDHRGKTPKKLGSDWVLDGIPAISAKNIHGGKLTNEDDIRYVTAEIYRKWMKEDVVKGDCLLVSEGATLGEYLYWDFEFPIVLSQRLFCIRTNPKVLYSRYFYAYVSSSNFQKQVFGRATGTSVEGLRQTEVLKLQIPITRIEKQKVIGDLLYYLEKKQTLLRQQNQTLEKLAQTLFKRWFVDFEFPDANGKSYRSSGGKMVESELGEIPEGWRVGTLGEIVINHDNKRIPLSSNERGKRQGIYPYHGATSVMDFIDDFIFDGRYLLLGEDGSVIDDNDYPILQFVEGKIWVNNHAHVLEGRSPFSTEYLFLLLRKMKISHIITGAVQLKINQGNLHGLEILIPKQNILNEFDKILNPNINKVFGNKKEIQTLTRLRDTLLPKLMSGELRVKVN